MVFSGIIFPFFFLPPVILLYYLIKKPYRNALLLIASLLFYAYGNPTNLLLLLGSILLNTLSANAIEKALHTNKESLARMLLLLAVAINLFLLFFYKYLGFCVDLINRLFHVSLFVIPPTLPIGISFFTFQGLSYVIAVYRGTSAAQKNPVNAALYISFFPQLVAGPIVRYQAIEPQLMERHCTPDAFSDGALRFMTGYAKKIILANQLALTADAVFVADPFTENPLMLWIGAVCYSLQIYFDFSGYSDMAIGLGKLFGFSFEENFSYPYTASSVADFWHRWHISLGRWFRDYVYFPLGGSRVPVPRQILNLLIVWLLTGLWHGANLTFAAWGLFYFVLLVFEKYLVRPATRRMPFQIFWRIMVLLFVNFGWVLFRADTIQDGFRFILSMLGASGIPFAVDAAILRFFREYGVFFAAAVLFSLPMVPRIRQSLQKKPVAAKALPPAEALLSGALFLWAVSFVIVGLHDPFIYFRF